MDKEQIARLDLLIDTVKTYSCGWTKDYVRGCLDNKWTKETILSGWYDVEIIKSSRDFEIWFISSKGCEFHTAILAKKKGLLEGSLDIKYIKDEKSIEEEIFKSLKEGNSIGVNLDGSPDDGHCFTLVMIDNNIQIVDSYTSKETQRKLSRRPFNFDVFIDLIKNPNPKKWSDLFLCEKYCHLQVNDFGSLNFEIEFIK